MTLIQAVRLVLPLMLLAGSALPLRGQVAVARMNASATVVEPVHASVEAARVERADGPVVVEVDVNLRGAVAWFVGGEDAAGARTADGAAGCGGWTGSTADAADAADARAEPAIPRPVRRLTAVVRCTAPNAGEVNPRPLEVRVLAIN